MGRKGLLIGAAVGSGNMALAAERGGADLILALNAGRLRTMGAPSIACMLPIFDADSMTEGFARQELLPQCKVPVLLGTSVWGRDFDPDGLARRLAEAGFAGAVNFPSAIHYTRPLQQLLERAGRGIEQEIAQLRRVQDEGLTAMFYAATRHQARLAADAGFDMVCLNLGWNVGGALGHRSSGSLEDAATQTRETGRLIKRISPRTQVFVEGGPIATADDLARVLARVPLDGYVGGSTFERMPLESSVADQIDRFRKAGRGSASLDRADADLLNWGQRQGFRGSAPALRGYLRELRARAASDHPLLLLLEPGQRLAPSIAALADASPKTPARLHLVDLATQAESVREANRLVFGDERSTSPLRPALADAELAHFVIQSPGQMGLAGQRRLARSLAEGRFRSYRGERLLTLATRPVLVVFLPSQATDEAAAIDACGLAPELRECLSGWILRPPPLRERSEDVAALLSQALGATKQRPDQLSQLMSAAALATLESHTWPGNESELTTFAGALLSRRGTGPVQIEDLPALLTGGRGAPSLGPDRSEKARVVDALWRNGFNRTRSAQALGISRKTLYNKMRRFDLLG